MGHVKNSELLNKLPEGPQNIPILLHIVPRKYGTLSQNMVTLSAWWYSYPSEKYEFVSWDDDIPNWMESHKIPWFQTTNQLLIIHLLTSINH